MSANRQTSANNTSSKVNNTKAEYKTQKKQLAESFIKESFSPLFSPKDGKARLTFCGINHKTITRKKSGKVEAKMDVVFSVLDVTHEAPVNIAIMCDYNLSEKNQLGRIFAIMGYQIKKSTEVVDEDDEYGVKTTVVNPREIFDFFRSKCGLVFKADLRPATETVQAREGNTVTVEVKEKKGLWDIVPETIAPFIKNGEQLRDLLPSDVTDEDFENPQIDMSNEG